MLWWLKLRADGEERGPYPTRDIARRRRRNELTEEAVVRLDEPDSDGEWSKIDEVGEIEDEISLLERERELPAGNDRARKNRGAELKFVVVAVGVFCGVGWIATLLAHDYLHVPWALAAVLGVGGLAAVAGAAVKWGF